MFLNPSFLLQFHGVLLLLLTEVELDALSSRLKGKQNPALPNAEVSSTAWKYPEHYQIGQSMVHKGLQGPPALHFY